MRSFLGVLPATGLAIGTLGCGNKGGEKGGSSGDNDAGAVAIPFDQVPPEMLKEAQRRMPHVTFDNARKKPDGTIELRGKDKSGKKGEVEFHPDGRVTEE
jgi:hypothetical protein